MLSLLTDSHVAIKVAEQVLAHRPEVSIQALRNWRDGAFLDAEDDVILQAARADGLTLVTYDQSTIVPLLIQWMTDGRDHAGVIFIDDRSIRQQDIGGQIRALVELWDKASADTWDNVVMYLKPRL